MTTTKREILIRHHKFAPKPYLMYEFRTHIAMAPGGKRMNKPTRIRTMYNLKFDLKTHKWTQWGIEFSPKKIRELFHRWDDSVRTFEQFYSNW